MELIVAFMLVLGIIVMLKKEPEMVPQTEDDHERPVPAQAVLTPEEQLKRQGWQGYSETEWQGYEVPTYARKGLSIKIDDEGDLMAQELSTAGSKGTANANAAASAHTVEI